MAKAGYVDGFVFPVPKKNLAAYKKMAKEGAEVWKKFGALDYYECVGEDLNPKAPDGQKRPRTFKEAAKSGSGDTVWFSFITFKSRAHRDQVNKKVMDYMGKKYANVDPKDFTMPFDEKKMAYGGFKVVISK